jgi:hypothetical protein
MLKKRKKMVKKKMKIKKKKRMKKSLHNLRDAENTPVAKEKVC